MNGQSAAVSDSFAALGEETRVAILEALVDARRERPADPGLSFSELRDRVGVTDSGRFNYHLGKLRGQFVEADAGEYELTYAGRKIVGAILAGTYDADVGVESERLDGPCPICDTAITATYDEGVLAVECEEDHPVLRTTVPPAVADRSMSALVAFAVRMLHAEFELLSGGICRECYGPIESEIVETGLEEGPDFGYRTECERCGSHTNSSAQAAILRDPGFIAFCDDHDVDVREHLPWTLSVFANGETTRTSEDPPRFRVHVETEREAFDAALDGEGDVVATERSEI